jgi:hypothetical protein
MHAVSLTPHARFLRPKIHHISANSKQNSNKKALARESEAQGVLFDKKTMVENLVTLSLSGRSWDRRWNRISNCGTAKDVIV